MLKDNENQSQSAVSQSLPSGAGAVLPSNLTASCHARIAAKDTRFCSPSMGCSTSIRVAKPLPSSKGLQRDVVGVSLDYLLQFVKKNGGQQLAGMTCCDVCDRVIKPMTLRAGYGSTTGQSVSQMLELAYDTRPGDVQKAHWYVVHTWSGLFLDLIASLQLFFADARNSSIAPPVLWIDLFCIDQHASDLSSCEQLIKTHVQPAMRGCGRIVFVAGAWKRTLALGRTWCLFELVQAHTSNFPVFVALVPAQRIIFLRFLEELASHKHFSDAIGRALLRQSKCSRNDDHAWLLQDLERSPGAADVEQCVESVVRGWLLMQLQQQLASSQSATGDKSAITKWMTLIGELLVDTGQVEAAVSMYQDALPLLHSTFGQQHARTISCSWALAKLLVRLERYNESVPLLTRCFETKKALLGPANESVLTLQNTLGSVLTSLREFGRAETMFVVSLTALRQLFGGSDVRTATAASALAGLYSKMGKMAQSAQCYRQACLHVMPAHMNCCNSQHTRSHREAASAFEASMGASCAQTLQTNV